MISKLEPVIWLRVLVTLAYMKGRTDVRTDVHDVMAIKPNFLTSMGYHIFLSMVLRARAPSARAELRLNFAGLAVSSDPVVVVTETFVFIEYAFPFFFNLH